MATYQYIIIGNANGGSGGNQSMSGTVSSVPAVVSLTFSNPSRTYYNFKGWNDSASATVGTYTTRIPINASTSEPYVKTVYAAWEHQTAYVYYNANGGSGAPSTQSHWAGYSVTLSATEPTRSGYLFQGWATSSDATTASYNAGGTYALYTTVTLYAVWKPAADELSASDGTLGTSLTITITKNDASYEDTITYSFGTATGTIVSGTTAESVTWTPPTSLASEIPNASSGTCTLTCSTYEDGTLLGTSSITITLTVPQSLAPTVSVSFTDTNATASGWGLYVQSRSKLAFTITATAQEGASVSSYATAVNASSYSSASFTTDVLLYSGTNTYTVIVTDSRGLQTTVTGTINVIAYAVPSFTITLCDRDDSDPTQVNVEFDYQVSSVNSNNAKNYAVDYKTKNSSSWTNGTTTALGSYSGTISTYLSGIDDGDEFDIRVRLIDSFTTASITSEVSAGGNIILNSRHKGGIGIGMKSQDENRIDLGFKAINHREVQEMYGSIVQGFDTSGSGYVKIFEFEAYTASVVGTAIVGTTYVGTDGFVGSPLTVEFIRTSDMKPTTLTINIGNGTIVSDNSTDAYLSSDALYIAKADSDDIIEILDMHNPWSNESLVIEWDGTLVNSLPTGCTPASGSNLQSMDVSNDYVHVADFGISNQSLEQVSVDLSSAGTVYGGTLNVLTGVLTVTHAYVALTGATWNKSGSYPGGFYFPISSFASTYNVPTPKAWTPFICSHAKTATSISEYLVGTCYCDSAINIRIMSSSDTASTWSAYLDEQYSAGTPVQICYTMATPVEYQLTAQQLSTLLGNNVVATSNGTISLTYSTSGGSTATVSGSSVSFNDGAEANVSALSATITAIQSGSGDPSTDNIRPISGITTLNIMRTANGLQSTTPFTLKYIRTTDSKPTELTIRFNDVFDLVNFVSDNSTEAYMADGSLYVATSSDDESVEILDVHNSSRNSDMTITWNGSSVGSLPTGYVQATN